MYPLSADISFIVNPAFAVCSISVLKYGLSCIRALLNSTLVTMCVVTPQVMCILIHSCQSSLLPYFTSNQRWKRVVEKPELSTANDVSIGLRGIALSAIRYFKKGVSDSIFK